MGSLIFLCITLVLLYPYRTVSLGSSNATATAATTQVLALLSFKSMVSDPSGLLASWNDSTHLCRWRGVGCGRKHPERVVELNLNSFGLSGRITPFLCNLSHLTVLDLAENQLVGQIPHELGHLGRLRVLNLTANSLQGSIPATLAGCAELVKLNLGLNLLQGKIPGEIGTLRNLVYLQLSTNDLSGEIPPSLGNLSMLAALGLANNTLSGEIPGEIGTLRNLVYLKLYSNDLSGEIPPSLGNLSMLASLDLANNTLSGEIPASFGNLSNLKGLALWMNQLTGGIPSSLGRLSNLSKLDLEINNLTGSIPHAIWNISSLTFFAVDTNELTGTIPPNAFNTLPLLKILYLGQNLFHGYLPSSLANASNLSGFEIPFNYFSGVVPSDLGGLQSLQWIVLANNGFESKESNDWKFITSLTNCSQLQGLELQYNRFSGMLPSAISNLSTSLGILSLSNNEISGNIPREIGNLGNLQTLLLNNNFLAGTIPSSFSMLRNLQVLWLQNNSLSGPISSTIGNLTKLNFLDLAMNAFSGIIPNTLGNMLSLLRLDLSTNNFTGMIPSSLFNITTLSIYLDISNNHLEGTIPLEVGNLQNLVEFDAMFNRLSGEIPITLGKCQLLQTLRLQNNSFSGNIPSLLSGLKGLEIVDLSNNNFSGQIPEFLGDLHTLYDLNLSFNNFDGEVPTVGVFANATGISVQGNGELCGGIQDLHLPPCSLQISKKRHKFPMLAFVVSLVATTVCILLLFLFFLTFHKKRSRESPSTMSMKGHQLVSYQQLTHATDGFSTTNLLGNGSYGSVYRGKLYDETGENENLVAVKVLKLQAPGALKSFTAECEAMRNIRHRNLVKIITACSSIDFNGNDFKAIVFDFMPNGSLEEWLHPNTNNQREERHLSLVQRVSILFDVACALDYLHFHGAAPIVHCDLKPSNVLLDADMVAHVGDFGLAKILAEGCSSFQPSISSLGFRGTIGYAPPEYGAGNMVSTRGDIYSYGVLILEMVTGKRPTDNTFEQGLSLRKYVEMALTSGVMDIIDMELVAELENGPATVDGPSNRRRFDSVISLLKLGMFCSEEMPSSRMSTKDIVKELLAIKTALV